MGFEPLGLRPPPRCPRPQRRACLDLIKGRELLGAKPVKAQTVVLDAILDALRASGVEVLEDGLKTDSQVTLAVRSAAALSRPLGKDAMPIGLQLQFLFLLKRQLGVRRVPERRHRSPFVPRCAVLHCHAPTRDSGRGFRFGGSFAFACLGSFSPRWRVLADTLPYEKPRYSAMSVGVAPIA